MSLLLFFSSGSVEEGPSAPPIPAIATLFEEDRPFMWEEMYAGLIPMQYAEEDNDYALLRFCEAVCVMLELPYWLVRDDHGGRIGWSIILDPTRGPDDILPWMRQIAGVTPAANETPDEVRQKILDGDVFKRGTPEALYKEAARLGQTRFVLVERDAGSAYKVKLQFDPAEYTPEAEATLIAMLPAGIKWGGETVAGIVYYSDVLETYTDYQDVLDSVTDYDELRGV